MDRDLVSSLAPAQSIRAQSLTAAANGLGVDLRGFNAAAVVFDFGAQGGTSPTHTFKVQESDDNSTFTDVADADLENGANAFVVNATNAGVYARGYIGQKRYIRAICSAVSGTSPTLLASAVVHRGAGSAPQTIS